MQSCAEKGRDGREMVERPEHVQELEYLACRGRVKLSLSVWLWKTEAGLTGGPTFSGKPSVAQSMVSGVSPGLNPSIYCSLLAMSL